MTRMGAAAARQVANAVLSQYVDLPRRRFEDDEPRPPVDWLRAQLQAGRGSDRVLRAPQRGRHSRRWGLRSHPGVLHAGGVGSVVTRRMPARYAASVWRDPDEGGVPPPSSHTVLLSP
jgi:hypothetical protein